MTHFSIKEDQETIQSGGFFCSACCIGRPAKEESKEHRGYCKFCVEILNKGSYFSRKNIEEGKQVKKIDAMAFIQANPGATVENKDGHYAVVTTEGKKVTKAEELPAKVKVVLTPVPEQPKKRGRLPLPVKDLKTGQVYPSMDAAKIANKIHIRLFDVKLEDGQPRFIKA